MIKETRLTKLVKNGQGLTTHTIQCAYCGDKRKYPLFSREGEEHIWCIKCKRTYKLDRNTLSTYKLEDIKYKQLTFKGV